MQDNAGQQNVQPKQQVLQQDAGAANGCNMRQWLHHIKVSM